MHETPLRALRAGGLLKNPGAVRARAAPTPRFGGVAGERSPLASPPPIFSTPCTIPHIHRLCRFIGPPTAQAGAVRSAFQQRRTTTQLPFHPARRARAARSQQRCSTSLHQPAGSSAAGSSVPPAHPPPCAAPAAVEAPPLW